MTRLLHTVAKGPATSKMLITLTKLPTGARLHGFPEEVPVNFNLTACSDFKLRGHLPRKTLQPCNGQQLLVKYQYFAGCTVGCNGLQQPHQGADQCARR